MRADLLRRYARNETAATAIEYGLIAAFISVAIMTSVFLFGDTLYTMFYSDLPGLLGG